MPSLLVFYDEKKIENPELPKIEDILKNTIAAIIFAEANKITITFQRTNSDSITKDLLIVLHASDFNLDANTCFRIEHELIDKLKKITFALHAPSH